MTHGEMKLLSGVMIQCRILIFVFFWVILGILFLSALQMTVFNRDCHQMNISASVDHGHSNHAGTDHQAGTQDSRGKPTVPCDHHTGCGDIFSCAAFCGSSAAIIPPVTLAQDMYFTSRPPATLVTGKHDAPSFLSDPPPRFVVR